MRRAAGSCCEPGSRTHRGPPPRRNGHLTVEEAATFSRLAVARLVPLPRSGVARICDPIPLSGRASSIDRGTVALARGAGARAGLSLPLLARGLVLHLLCRGHVPVGGTIAVGCGLIAIRGRLVLVGARLVGLRGGLVPIRGCLVAIGCGLVRICRGLVGPTGSLAVVHESTLTRAYTRVRLD